MRLPTSTAYRYVRELRRARLLEVAADGRYRLGARLIDLVRLARGPGSLVWLARPRLQALADATGEQISLSHLSGNVVVCIDQIEPKTPRLVRLGVEPGDPVPLRGAAPRAIVAQLPPERALTLLGHWQTGDPVPQQPKSPQEWLAELARIREQGCAYAELEAVGMRAIAAAFTVSGREPAAVTVSGPLYCLTDERLPELVRQVRETAAAIAAELTHT